MTASGDADVRDAPSATLSRADPGDEDRNVVGQLAMPRFPSVTNNGAAEITEPLTLRGHVPHHHHTGPCGRRCRRAGGRWHGGWAGKPSGYECTGAASAI